MPELRLLGGRLDGLALHYVVEGRGPAVVLVHGLGGFAESWRHNFDALAQRATVYAVDLPGFGRSAKPFAQYNLAFFAAALHGFLEALGVHHASLVGHSLGGAFVLTYALTHPARVDRVALVGGLVPGFGYRPSRVYRLLALRGIGEALALCGCAPVYRAALARCFYRPAPDEIAFLVECGYGARTGWDARAAYLATLRAARRDFERYRTEYRRALASLDIPVLAIHGRQDLVIPAAHCAEVAGGLARAEVRWIDACGHFPQIEHAQTVNEWLAEFLVARPAPR
ncbi:MAG TPA: alpha/beta fold hydrolase [Methylomirabilota bacterium]|jgi:pyruvate dehydrogenase E2 component (dihydrolipoamide acetyltransferase)|nr:alpha/beta fold hydrolase [Methylomirabilota bacterium]